jgi:glycosyltransferase involved in cell wall biosynthesis
MTDRNNFTLVFNHFEIEHFGKDVFLVPYYLGKLYNFDVTIVYPKTDSNKNFPFKVRGVNLKPVKNIFSKKPHSGLRILKELVFLLYVIRNAKKINFLMCFSLSEETVLIGAFYKWLNPKGFLYIKADGDLYTLYGDFSINSIKMPLKLLKRKIYTSFVKSFNLITVETERIYRTIPALKILGMTITPKVQLLYNGFDKEQFLQHNIIKRTFAEKENLIITVGRLGTRQKNTELLLEALEKINLKDWIIAFIGSIEKEECDFQKNIETFYLKNPHLQEKVIFTGQINDKELLWEWYNRAKMFVLPSRYEGFANVLAEAFIFKNYIIATDVGGVGEIINFGYGELFPQDNSTYLCKTLQRLIDEERFETLYKKVDWESVDISWETLIKKSFEGFLI